MTLRAVFRNTAPAWSRVFTRDYGVRTLVFAEFHEIMEAAILREKRLKKWRRAWKLELIEQHNPHWRDLYDELAL